VTEALALTAYEEKAPSAWEWARAKYPDAIVVRIINVETRKQAFVKLEEETGFMLDGSTHYIGVPPGGLSVDDEAALVAECDRDWCQTLQ